MDCFLLQDWLALSSASGGAGSTVSIPQSEAGWLDLGAYRDVVAWVEVKELSSSSLSIGLQSAVAKEELLFATMGSTPSPLTTGVKVVPMLQELQTGAAGAAPLARWLRWQVSLSGGSGWDVTFRIWIAANKPGRAALNRGAAARR